MFRNRWIRVPLIAASYWFILYLLFRRPDESIWGTIFRALFFGLTLEGFSWLSVRMKYGDVGPDAREPHQKRTLMLMQDIGQALETCKIAVESLSRLVLRDVDPISNRVVFRSKANFRSWGSRFTIDLREVAPHLTEVVIETKPRLPTILIDSGEAWKRINEIVAAIKELDSDPGPASLKDGTEMLRDLTIRPIDLSRKS